MKLESLKKFKVESNNLSSIFGGLADAGGKWIQTKKPSTTDSNGCVVNTTDSYFDANGNGKYDSGESATACVSIDCGN